MINVIICRKWKIYLYEKLNLSKKMTKLFSLLVNYSNGIFMLAFFGLVCVGLIAAVFMLMYGDKKKKE
jgi:hypothetical protein